MLLHVLARVLLHMLVQTVHWFGLARVVKHVLARVLLHVLAYYSKTCVLDHAHLRRTVSKPKVEVKTFSHYYTDHDSVTCVL